MNTVEQRHMLTEETILHRFFSKFPDGAAGAGLFVLRAVLGIMALVQGGFSLFGRENPSTWAQVWGLSAIIAGASLLLGFLTPLFCFIIFLDSVVSIFLSFQITNPFLPAVCGMAVSAALILLGPGAFSLDARLFGRREIIIPTQSPKS